MTDMLTDPHKKPRRKQGPSFGGKVGRGLDDFLFDGEVQKTLESDKFAAVKDTLGAPFRIPSALSNGLHNLFHDKDEGKPEADRKPAISSRKMSISDRIDQAISKPGKHYTPLQQIGKLVAGAGAGTLIGVGLASVISGPVGLAVAGVGAIAGWVLGQRAIEGVYDEAATHKKAAAAPKSKESEKKFYPAGIQPGREGKLQGIVEQDAEFVKRFRPRPEKSAGKSSAEDSGTPEYIQEILASRRGAKPKEVIDTTAEAAPDSGKDAGGRSRR